MYFWQIVHDSTPGFRRHNIFLLIITCICTFQKAIHKSWNFILIFGNNAHPTSINFSELSENLRQMFQFPYVVSPVLKNYAAVFIRFDNYKVLVGSFFKKIQSFALMCGNLRLERVVGGQSYLLNGWSFIVLHVYLQTLKILHEMLWYPNKQCFFLRWN